MGPVYLRVPPCTWPRSFVQQRGLAKHRRGERFFPYNLGLSMDRRKEVGHDVMAGQEGFAETES